MKLLSFVITLFLGTLVSNAHDVAWAIAQSYGLNKWNKVESITYTFNFKNQTREMARTWTWYPRKDIVYSHKDDVKYNRKEAINEAIDKGFINDLYWLLYPFHIVWDKSVSVEEVDGTIDPISGKPSHMIRVTHNKEDGYTPGDAYELFYDKDARITAWNFIRGGTGEGRPMSWEGNKTINGITFSTEHKGPDGSRLWFSDIEVKLK